MEDVDADVVPFGREKCLGDAVIAQWFCIEGRHGYAEHRVTLGP